MLPLLPVLGNVTFINCSLLWKLTVLQEPAILPNFLSLQLLRCSKARAGNCCLKWPSGRVQVTHSRTQELWHPLESPVSHQVGKTADPKGTSLRVKILPVVCILPWRQRYSHLTGHNLLLGRAKALPAVISNICWLLLRCLPSGNAWEFPLCVSFFSLPLHFLLQPVRKLPCCICLDYVYWKGIAVSVLKTHIFHAK